MCNEKEKLCAINGGRYKGGNKEEMSIGIL